MATLMPTPDEVALRCTDIQVRFGDVVVLRGVSLNIRRGEVHVLIGPNGAGKTTLANAITGHVPVAAGTVELDGRPLTGPPWRRARRGVGRKFQVPRVFGPLSARHNLQVAHRNHPTVDHIEELGAWADVPASQLSHGWRQWLELQMVLARQPSLVVLDEPTAGMALAERTALAGTIRAELGGATVLVVEHDLDFVARIADRVSFLQDGRLIRTGSIDELRADPLVRAVYAGSESL